LIRLADDPDPKLAAIIRPAERHLVDMGLMILGDRLPYVAADPAAHRAEDIVDRHRRAGGGLRAGWVMGLPGDGLQGEARRRTLTGLGELALLDRGEPGTQRIADNGVDHRRRHEGRRRAGDQLAGRTAPHHRDRRRRLVEDLPGLRQGADMDRGGQGAALAGSQRQRAEQAQQNGADWVMMPAMKHVPWLLLALLTLFPAASRAQFYDLDGAYRCLTTPDAACEKDLRLQPQTKPPVAEPSLEQVIARVRDRTVTPRDIDFLEKRAAANDPRAVEVLAWCKLNGIGTPADALGAFWLYGQAASLGVANARKNQIAIYETRLTSDQRQQVLARESNR
jgi:hypothetical protein